MRGLVSPTTPRFSTAPTADIMSSAFWRLATLWTAAVAQTCDEKTLASARESFKKNGYAVLPGFASKSEVDAMLSSMSDLVAAWWQDERAAQSVRSHEEREAAVFRTDENQTAAQAQSKYFFDSANRVSFFREPTEEEDGEAPPPLNKVGHGLHLDGKTPFGTYAQSIAVRDVARRVAGLTAPVLPQSMYIFKAARVGGSVTSHQDGTFLYTRPQQTVVGLWLALHEAHTANGCLWARPGSHREPLRRRFVRGVGDDGSVAMKFLNVSVSAPEVNAAAEEREAYLSPVLLGEGTPALPPQPRTGLARWWDDLRRAVTRAVGGAGATRSARRRLARSEEARLWEGHWPPKDTTPDARAISALKAHGFVPLVVKAGDLVVLAGTLDHLSLPNLSPHDRHTFQLHMVESENTTWAPENWLQYPDGAEFPRL